MRSYPLSFVMGGSIAWGNGALYGQGVVGHWWSSTIFSGSYAFYMGMRSSTVGTSGSDPIKAFGFPLRYM